MKQNRPQSQKEDLYQIGYDEGYQYGCNDASRGMPYNSHISKYPTEDFLVGYEDGYNQGYRRN